jgi:hypothetical protein
MEASAPDLITAVIGFRQWRLVGTELWSFRADDRWHRGVHTAHCPVHHVAPANADARRITPDVPSNAGPIRPDLVGGAVALWGR